MTSSAPLSPAAIRSARAASSQLRERDFAAKLGIAEAQFDAAWCGDGVTRIEANVNDALLSLGAVGEVMALTRNESAVHEKIGVYDKVVAGAHTALVLGKQIDLRIFPGNWVHGFAVEKEVDGDVRRSLQFFDAAGTAVHKVHLRPASDVGAYARLVDKLRSADQGRTVELRPLAAEDVETPTSQVAGLLRQRWSGMSDVHQFFGILRDLKITRHEAVSRIGEDYAWQADREALAAMIRLAAEGAVPIMCFVGSRGCIQIHSGPIRNVTTMGPWINIVDATFNLHLRDDHIVEVWTVRRPTKDGYVTSVEAYDGEKNLIIQFFGERHEGEVERADWRRLAESLPRLSRPTAA